MCCYSRAAALYVYVVQQQGNLNSTMLRNAYGKYSWQNFKSSTSYACINTYKRRDAANGKLYLRNARPRSNAVTYVRINIDQRTLRAYTLDFLRWIATASIAPFRRCFAVYEEWLKNCAKTRRFSRRTRHFDVVGTIVSIIRYGNSTEGSPFINNDGGGRGGRF